jgi:hypothetical protein
MGPFSGVDVGLASSAFMIQDENSFHPDWMSADGTKRVYPRIPPSLFSLFPLFGRTFMAWV